MSSSPSDGNVDAADIEVTEPPEGWAPELIDAEPNPADVRDNDEDADD